MIEEALMALAPSAKWSIIDGVIDWQSPEIPQPSQAEIDAKIAELQAASPVIPDWHGFILSMDGLFPIGLQANYLVFTQIFNMLLALRDKRLPANDSSIEWRNFAFNWEMGKSAFSPEQIAEIQAKMQMFNVPVI